MRGRGFRLTALGAVLIPALFAGQALAHERSYSYSQWSIEESGARVSLRLAARDLARLPLAGPGREQALHSYLSSRLRLVAGQHPCQPSGGVRRLRAARGFERFEWGYDCGPDRPFRLSSSLFVEIAPRHLNFASIDLNGVSLEAVLGAGDEPFTLGGSQSGGDTSRTEAFLSYVSVGFEHIVSGYDHLAFLVALLLVGTTLVETAALVTGFTVGHSITLALAVFGMARPAPAAVEAVIGLSIALVAAENIWLSGGRHPWEPRALVALLAILALAAALGFGQMAWLVLAGLALFAFCYFAILEQSPRPGRMRWWVAAAFGLAHGFGFAGALVEGGLPADYLGSALAGFNVGVELGQLGFVLVAWPLLGALVSRGERGRSFAQLASTAVLALGVFWFVRRNY